MKPTIKNPFLLSGLIAALALTQVGRATGQTFTVLKSFGIFTNITGFNPQSTLVQGADGALYGTARNGESIVAGTVFKLQPDGSGFTVLKWFTNSNEGANPVAGLALSGSALYGTTSAGGSSNLGTVFKINTDGTGYTVLKHFTGSDGAGPYYAGLTLSDSALYGTTYYGGSSNLGTVFRLNADGTGYTVLHDFTDAPDGAYPDFALTVSGGVLYGTTENGGNSGAGTVFKLNADGTGYTVLVNFTNSPDGAYPDSVLTLSGSALYGTTYRGGSNYSGTVFTVNTDGTGYAVLKTFTGDDGAQPAGPLPLSGSVLYGTTSQGGSNGVGTVFRINTDGTGYAILKNFANSPDGANPFAGLMLSGSVLFGTTGGGGGVSPGGGAGYGTVFKVSTDGTAYTALKNFAYSDATTPYAGLTLSGTVLYGTTASGGGNPGGGPAYGTVFKVNPDGTGYTVLKSFTNSPDGAYPFAGLASSGSVLYGTTGQGGSSGNGTLFKVNTDGTGYTVLKNFTGGSDGSGPVDLTLSGSVLYGAAYGGGSSYAGTVFKMNTDGTGYTVLKNFAGSDGGGPAAGLTLSGGVLYGTTLQGGSSYYGTVFRVNANGTGYTVLKNFTNSPDGAYPESKLTLSGSVLYGTTSQGGSSNCGTVFKVNANGTGYAVLKHFTNSPDGAYPFAGLTLSGSALYGTTFRGGTSDNGTVFKINTDGTGYTVLKTFANSPDGSNPHAGLALSGNVLYGTTQVGGSMGNGTVFSLSFQPQLAITPSGSNVILTWPTNVAGFDYTGFTLQSTTNLLSPAAWVTNSPSPVVIAGQNTVTNPILGAQTFFRLVQ